MSAPRRSDVQMSYPVTKWGKFWRYVYISVSIASYLVMLVSFALGVYWGLVVANYQRGLLAGLVSLLAIYINKVSPKE